MGTGSIARGRRAQPIVKFADGAHALGRSDALHELLNEGTGDLGTSEFVQGREEDAMPDSRR